MIHHLTGREERKKEKERGEKTKEIKENYKLSYSFKEDEANLVLKNGESWRIDIIIRKLRLTACRPLVTFLYYSIGKTMSV